MLFAVVSAAYLIAAIPWEEASLVEAFGEKYRAYQRQMRGAYSRNLVKFLACAAGACGFARRAKPTVCPE